MPGEITHDAGIATAASTTSPKLVQPDLSSMGDAAQSPYIPQGSQDSCDSRTKCFYGRESCAWLRHSNELVVDLERDVVRAGKEGQALLIRHETYVADAEARGREMTSRITHLESDKLHLETENHRLVEENEDLTEQLVQLNTKVEESEARIETLEATLHATHMEMRRLESLADRTNDLEQQLEELEREQEALRNTHIETEAEARAANRRWREADRRVGDLQDQLEKIEREAHAEKLRHEEVLRRMERQRCVDRELHGKTVVKENGKGNVVSNFVKDILQDNVNLQMGIVELREMLMSSNDEVQKLRDQLMGRGPEEAEDDPRAIVESSLETELAIKDPPTPTQALHVHHHYHVPKAAEARRAVPKKKRQVSIPERGMHSRNSSRNRHRQQPSIASTILSQTSMTIPSTSRPQNSHRWSTQSYGAPSEFASSAPSSPQEYRSSVLFDRMSIDQSMDYSRPTSPELSDCAMSPNFRSQHKRKESEQSSNSSRNISPRGPPVYQNDTIHEEEDDDVPHMAELEPPRNPVTQDDSAVGLESSQTEDIFDSFSSSHAFQPKLRRRNSHESILSLAGQDIHTLQSRPSQMNISRSGVMFNPTLRSRRSQIGASSAVLSTVDVLGTGELSAAGALLKNQDSRSLLRSAAGLPERPMTAKSLASSEDTVVGSAPNNGGKGGWIWGRWGMKPGPSLEVPTQNSRSKSAASSLVDVHPPPNAQMKKLAARAASMPIKRLKEKVKDTDPLKLMLGRSPGINVAGPIPGWKKPAKAPSQVQPLRVDFEALKEVLEEA